MVTVPADTPVITPMVLSAMLPMAGFELLHVPPAVEELKVVVLPTHTDVVPVKAAGIGFTVRLLLIRQVTVPGYVTE
jgi:hypothetical protein